MNKQSKILVLGARGMVGSAIVRCLIHRKYSILLTPGRDELDLLDYGTTHALISGCLTQCKPDVIFLAAAKVGGIQANIDDPYQFLYHNLVLQNNVLEAARRCEIPRLIFFSSSCVYPRECPQPMKEEYLLTGPLEPTNEGYALAKIAGMKLIEAARKQFGLRWVSVVPCNLYGPGDCFLPEKGHVLAALVTRFLVAKREGKKSITLWGTGRARREFLHVNDAAEAIVAVAERYNERPAINVGSGQDWHISSLALTIAKAVGYEGEIVWDTSKPDGMPRKCTDVSRLDELGFISKIPLDVGIRQMIDECNRFLNR